jgi:hypothetical protein
LDSALYYKGSPDTLFCRQGRITLEFRYNLNDFFLEKGSSISNSVSVSGSDEKRISD